MLAVAVTAVPAFASVGTPPAGTADAQPAVPDTLNAVLYAKHARPLVTRIVHASARRTYTVVAGDTLTGIAGRFCGSAGKWPSLNHGNHAAIKDPDLIYPGQTIRLTCHDPALLPAVTDAQADPASAAPVRHDRFDGQHGQCGDGDGDGMDAPCSAIFGTPAPATARVTRASGTLGGNVNPGDYSGFQACVIARESGGDSQVMNSSGHYGLYQFSASTWEAYGGSAADFGHASVAEQNQVFATAMAQGGENNWSPYDGC